MIKLLREGNQKFPWALKAVMIAIALTFIVGMGWWGYGESQTDTIATIGPLKITRDEYMRRYKNLYEYAKKQKMPDAVKDEVLKEMAVEQMAEEKLWRLAADEMGLTLSPEELHAAITRIADFQQNGKFDPELYKRLLAFNHLTPPQFEAEYGARLLGDKAMSVVFDSVALTPAEIEEAKTLMARPSSPDSPAGLSARDRILQDMLFQKQQRAVMAFREAMRVKVNVQIKKELL
ncbi:MAG TPA: SurA N-terminal domain-containing protein [Nitrospiraceae bacterium]|nr:SurA N-terminal domain-containing protein [Nitrospiraceae bacterium]